MARIHTLGKEDARLLGMLEHLYCELSLVLVNEGLLQVRKERAKVLKWIMELRVTRVINTNKISYKESVKANSNKTVSIEAG